MRRTPLKRSTPLRCRSRRMEAIYRQRRPFVARLLAENPQCQFPDCTRRSDDVHELLSRARGGSILDAANCRCLCRPCHEWVTGNPAEAARLGLALSREAAA